VIGGLKNKSFLFGGLNYYSYLWLMEKEIYELKKRLEWFIDGIGIHNIPWSLFHVMTAENICRLYNVEPEFFNLK